MAVYLRNIPVNQFFQIWQDTFLINILSFYDTFFNAKNQLFIFFVDFFV